LYLLGGVHVFSRHNPATIMIAKGCDCRIVQELLRHKDIRTTLRYAHVSDKTKREKYEQYLRLYLKKGIDMHLANSPYI